MEVSFVVQFPTLRDASSGRAAEVETKANPTTKSMQVHKPFTMLLGKQFRAASFLQIHEGVKLLASIQPRLMHPSFGVLAPRADLDHN